ncbi:hypothetical protein OROGR_025215 [Orobanche gracilis]
MLNQDQIGMLVSSPSQNHSEGPEAQIRVLVSSPSQIAQLKYRPSDSETSLPPSPSSASSQIAQSKYRPSDLETSLPPSPSLLEAQFLLAQMSRMELNDRDYLKFLQEDSKVVRNDFFTSVTGQVDFTWANERKLCGPLDQLDSSNYLRSLRDGYSFGLPRGEEVWSECEWASPLLHPISSGLYASFQVQNDRCKIMFQGNKGVCRDPRCDENLSTQKGRSRRLQAHGPPHIDQNCVRVNVRDEKLTSTSLTNFDEPKEVIKDSSGYSSKVDKKVSKFQHRTSCRCGVSTGFSTFVLCWHVGNTVTRSKGTNPSVITDETFKATLLDDPYDITIKVMSCDIIQPDSTSVSTPPHTPNYSHGVKEPSNISGLNEQSDLVELISTLVTFSDDKLLGMIKNYCCPDEDQDLQKVRKYFKSVSVAR